jgi:4-amino-4-deoxy-L-arabinose transferase-like glycosyltransferase
MTTTLTSPVSPPLVAPVQRRPITSRLLRGNLGEPVWARPALLILLLATALLYLWGLSASGWANSFYAAAAQAGSASWKAWFFGSSDASNSITVDKTPGALWVTGLSVRIFGLNSWSVLVPQALEGVATVGLLYSTVRRWFGPGAGLIAGAVLATTPVATLMFRFNNPDALLMLLLVAGVYGVVRALEDARTWWLVFAASCVGFGFLTKMLQALLVVPAFALVYLLCAPTSFRRRLVQLLIAGAAMVASAGWWVAIVELTPAKYRPYIGGSQTNSILELTLGYNGLGRITGNETGSVGGGGGGQGGGWGPTGWSRMLNAEMGGQIAWLLPAALVFMVVGIALAGRAPRTDRFRAAFVLWGGWLVVTTLVFSFMQGIFHAYYTIALAPAIAALVGMGATVLWRARTNILAASVLAATIAGTAVWSYILLGRSADFHPWLRTVVLVVGLGAAAAVVGISYLSGRLAGRLSVAVAVAAILATLAGPAAYSLDTASTAHHGAIVSAGPTVAGAGFGGGRGGPGGGFRGGPPGGFGGRFPGGGNGATGGNGARNGAGGQTQPGQTPPGGNGNAAGGRIGGGGMGGLLDGTAPSAEVVQLLKANSSSYAWVAAAVGAMNASGYQLSTGQPVMPIGGFNGSDPSPTLAQFKAYVAAGKIHYFIEGGGFGGGGFGGGRSSGGSNASSEIAAWVAANYTATTVGGTTLYDLSAHA